MRRANAKRKTRVAIRQRYNTQVVRFPNVRAFNDSFYGGQSLPFFKMKGFYVPSLYLSTLSDLSSQYPLTLAQIRQKNARKNYKISLALAQGIYDRRFYKPAFLSPLASATVSGASDVVPRGVFAHRFGFSVPRKVLTCLRRRQRKQVLHALGKTGKVGQKKPKWNDESYINC